MFDNFLYTFSVIDVDLIDDIWRYHMTNEILLCTSTSDKTQKDFLKPKLIIRLQPGRVNVTSFRKLPVQINDPYS